MARNEMTRKKKGLWLKIVKVRFVDDLMLAYLSDGRVIGHPYTWIKFLREATPEQRDAWELQDPYMGIEWPALGNGLSLEGLFAYSPDGWKPVWENFVP